MESSKNQQTESIPEKHQKFFDSLDDKQKKSYEIAQSHLGSSFDLEKSIAYLRFCKSNL